MTTKPKKDLDTSDVRPGPHKSVAGDHDARLMRRPDGRLILERIDPKALRQATPRQREALDNVQMHALTIFRANEGLAESVAEARKAGLSWESIGWNMGITGQAVRKRFGE